MRKGLASRKDRIFDSGQLADSCLGTCVGQAGFKDGELWQMDTESNETASFCVKSRISLAGSRVLRGWIELGVTLV